LVIMTSSGIRSLFGHRVPHVLPHEAFTHWLVPKLKSRLKVSNVRICPFAAALGSSCICFVVFSKTLNLTSHSHVRGS
jgi:hypothetical protein